MSEALFESLKETGKPIKIYAEQLETSALQQFVDVMALDCVVKGALMPDAHTGYSLPIGGVVATKNMIFPAFIGYDIGCTDKDTEFLSPTGWKKISEWHGDRVMQYRDGIAEFVDPNAYIKLPCDYFYHFETKYGIDQMLSSEHRIPYMIGHSNKNSKIRFEVKTAEEVVNHHESKINGFRGRFLTAFSVEEFGKGLLVSDSNLRVQVMAMADGHFDQRRDNHRCLIRVKKQRKIDRAQNLLKNARISYTLTGAKDGATEIKFNAPIREKSMGIFWNLSASQLKIVFDEIIYWDGHKKDRCYFTRDKNSADFVNFLFSSQGKRSVMREDKNYRDGKIDYRVYWHENTEVGLSCNKKNKSVVQRINSPDGFKYCFNVDSSFWIMRRNGKVAITGNCGMCALPIHDVNVDLLRKKSNEVHARILRDIPTGPKHHQGDQAWNESDDLDRTSFTDNEFAKKGLRQIGTLGGGNHFIEVGVDESDLVWAIIHSGSRNFGHHIATHYMKLASGDGHAREGAFGFDVNSQNGQDYIKDLQFALAFALANRKAMMHHVEKAISKIAGGAADFNELINRNHNHAEYRMIPLEGSEDHSRGVWVHRKGATHADAGMMGVIPGNMRDGSFIVRGKGNPDSLFSSSHGAGRLMSRKEARESISMGDFKDTMAASGVYATVTKGTLDECPMAYKDIFRVMELQKDLVDVVAYVKPVLNVKADEEPMDWKTRKAMKAKYGGEIPCI